MILRYIEINTTFEAIHCWPDCPYPEVDFLQEPHRHIFYVRMRWKVSHNDRDKEFIIMKRRVDEHLSEFYNKINLEDASCEDIAESLLRRFNACYVKVSEDGENGAILKIKKKKIKKAKAYKC